MTQQSPFKVNQVWIHKGRSVKIENITYQDAGSFSGILSYDSGFCTVHRHGYFEVDDFEEFVGYDSLYPELPSYTEAIINFVKNPSAQSEQLLRFVSK